MFRRTIIDRRGNRIIYVSKEKITYKLIATANIMAIHIGTPLILYLY